MFCRDARVSCSIQVRPTVKKSSPQTTLIPIFQSRYSTGQLTDAPVAVAEGEHRPTLGNQDGHRRDHHQHEEKFPVSHVEVGLEAEKEKSEKVKLGAGVGDVAADVLNPQLGHHEEDPHRQTQRRQR